MRANTSDLSIIELCQAPLDNPQLAKMIFAALPGQAARQSFNTKDELIFPSTWNVQTTRRLVVIVPENDFNEIELARRIWSLASPAWLPVLYLALHPGDGQMSAVHQRLAAVVSLTTGEHTLSSSKVLVEKNWLQALPKELLPGDLLICFEHQMARPRSLSKARLSQELARELKQPVYILESPRLGASPRFENVTKQSAFWLGLVAVLIGSGWVQFLLQRSFHGAVYLLVMFAAVVMEILAIVGIGQWTG